MEDEKSPEKLYWCLCLHWYGVWRYKGWIGKWGI